jgi:hypothetical protein
MHMARGGDAQGGEGGCTCILCIPPGYATAARPSFAEPYGEIDYLERKPRENSSSGKNTTAYIVQQSNGRWHFEPTCFSI